MTNTKTTTKMKTQKNTIQSEFVLEGAKGYIYRSVTPYDKTTDVVQYSVSGNNGDEFGRFETYDDALTCYNELF